SWILERWTPEAAVELLVSGRCTLAVAIPTQLVMMLDLPLEDHDFSALRAFVNGGAPLPPAAAAEVERRLDCRIVGIYGASESAIPTIIRLEDPQEKRRGTVG